MTKDGDEQEKECKSVEHSASGEYESSSSVDDVAAQFGSKNLDFGKQHVTNALCMNCGAQGVMKLLFLDIPKFHEVIVSSFKCKHCGFQGRDIEAAGDIEILGNRITLKVMSNKDLSRGLVKSALATTTIPELGFEIPPRPMSGVYSTVEGVIRSAISNLNLLQAERRQHQPEYAAQLDLFITKAERLLKRANDQTEKAAEQLFTLVLSDPSGNSHIEPLDDTSNLVEEYFERSAEESKQVGLSQEQELEIQKEAKTVVVDPTKLDDVTVMCGDASVTAELPTKCPACSADIMNKSVIINIPYFKDCLLMCATCEQCGYKSIEISNAGPISPLGKKTIFRVEDQDDLSRDVMKSDSCTVEISELGIRLEAGTMGGVYTTLEGLITMLKQELNKNTMFWFGDGYRSSEEQDKYMEVMADLDRMIAGQMPFTIIIDDPLDSSFIKNVYAPDPDPNMQIVSYERSKEQNEEYGLDMMNAGNE